MSINIHTDTSTLIAVTAKYAPATGRKPRRVRMKLPRPMGESGTFRKRIIPQDQEVDDALQVAADFIFAYAGLVPVSTCQSSVGSTHDTLLYKWYSEGNENTEENNFEILGDSVFSLGRVKQHPRVQRLAYETDEQEVRSTEIPTESERNDYEQRLEEGGIARA